MQHKILAETPETESGSATLWDVPMFLETGGNGQGIFGWNSERVKELLLRQGKAKCGTIRE